MTTIAYDGRYLAADSQVTTSPNRQGYFCKGCGKSANQVISNNAKKIAAGNGGTFKGEQVIAAAGSGGGNVVEFYTKYLTENREGDQTLSIINAATPVREFTTREMASVIFVFTETKVYKIDFDGRGHNTVVEVEDSFLVTGSGGTVANTAMRIYGQTAMKGIQDAATLDFKTGGDIKFIDILAARKDLSTAEIKTFTVAQFEPPKPPRKPSFNRSSKTAK